MSASRPTHLNARGEARMVDVGGKPASVRLAIAEGWIRMNAQTLAALQSGAQKKGDAFAVARIAGIMAAKRTAEWVPLCHPLMLTRVEVELRADGEAVHCTATTATRERTGVEMEALCAVQAALLTLYDMGKSLQRAMVIDNVRLVHKSGGRSGEWNRGEEKPMIHPIRNEDGVIINALALQADDVTGKKVACPVCGEFPPFQTWPQGWDEHAESPNACKGLRAIGPEKRKAEYKAATAHLFR